jgi:hypothetical protein
MQPFVQQPLDMVEELGQARRVASHPIVMVIPAKFPIACLHQVRQALVSRLFHPGGAVAQRFLQPRPCGPTLEPILAFAVLAPHKRTAQEVTATFGVFLVPTAAQQSRFLRGQLSTVLPEPLASHPVETLRIPLVLEGTAKVLSVATQDGLAFAMRFDVFCTPDIQDMMEVHIRQDR